MKKSERPVIGYVLGRFPCLSETFIANEIKILGNDFRIVVFALERNGDAVARQNDVVRLPRIFALSFFGVHLAEFVRSPRHYGAVLVRTLRRKGLRIGLAAFYKSIYFCRSLRKYGVAHLHAHFANRPTDIAMVLADMSGLEFSFTAHAKDIYVDERFLSEKIRACRFFTVCSRYGARYISERLGTAALERKMHVIYHGIVLENWPFHRRNRMKKVRILSVGRLIEKKGFDVLLKAVALVARESPGITCEIVGEGKDYSALKVLCARLGIARIVTFHGYRTQAEIRHMLEEVSLFVLPCRRTANGDSDSIPNVLLEAMASGVLVISTHVGGIAEILNDTNSVLLARAEPADVAKTILRLAAEPELSVRLAANARKTIEQYDARSCVAQLKNLFEEVACIRNLSNQS